MPSIKSFPYLHCAHLQDWLQKSPHNWTARRSVEPWQGGHLFLVLLVKALLRSTGLSVRPNTVRNVDIQRVWIPIGTETVRQAIRSTSAYTAKHPSFEHLSDGVRQAVPPAGFQVDVLKVLDC